MNIKGIIFDKDGTLMDFASFWTPVAENAVNSILDMVGGALSLSDKMLKSIGAYSGIRGVLCSGTYEQISDEFYNILKEHTEVDRRQLLGITSQAFHNSIGYGEIIPACNNIVDVFAELGSKYKTLALVTTDDEYITRKCLDELGIYNFFDRIYADDGIHPSKPNPYYISKLCMEEGLSPEELVMVGDTMTDIKFAKNSGIMSIGVAKSMEDKEVLRGKADHIIRDISQINSVLG